MRRSTLSRFAITLFLLIASLNVSANDRLIDSLEWASIDAEMIVRAKAHVSQSVPTLPGDMIRWNKIDLEILETIKGPAASHLKVAEWTDVRGWGIAVDSNNGDLLIFLDRRQRFGEGTNMLGECEWVVRKQGGWYVTHNTSEAMFHSRFGLMSFTEETLVGSELLDRVRKIAAWSLHAGDVPHRNVDSFCYPWKATSENGMIVPIAEPFIQQMRDFAAHDDSKIEIDDVPTLPPWNEHYFIGRDRGYRMLKTLNFSADRPILSGPAEIHEPAGRTLIGIALILFAWPIGWIFARRKNGQRFRFSSMFAIWRLAIAIALTIAWLLSYRQAISIAWVHNGARWQLASYGGVLRLASVKESFAERTPRPLGVVGAFFWLDPDNAANWDLRNVALTGAWDKWGITIGEGTPTIAYPPSRFRFGSPPQPAIWVAIIPWLWPVITLGPLALILAISQLRKWQAHRTRSREGHCPVCGYDLRATPDRCPECGTSRKLNSIES